MFTPSAVGGGPTGARGGHDLVGSLGRSIIKTHKAGLRGRTKGGRAGRREGVRGVEQRGRCRSRVYASD